MAKKPTNAELQRQLNIANKAVHDQMQTIDSLQKEVETIRKNSDRRFDSLIEDLTNLMRPAYYASVDERIFTGTVDRGRLQQMGITAIFARIGRLITIEDEYIELKDRTLPLPKQKILDQENENNRRV